MKAENKRDLALPAAAEKGEGKLQAGNALAGTDSTPRPDDVAASDAGLSPRRETSRRARWITIVFALAVLLPSLYGFGTKFIELVALCRGDMTGAFAIAPIVNYLLASAGFLMLFGWAAANGMFHDIERPKYTMLENERRLDAGK